MDLYKFVFEITDGEHSYDEEEFLVVGSIDEAWEASKGYIEKWVHPKGYVSEVNGEIVGMEYGAGGRGIRVKQLTVMEPFTVFDKDHNAYSVSFELVRKQSSNFSRIPVTSMTTDQLISSARIDIETAESLDVSLPPEMAILCMTNTALVKTLLAIYSMLQSNGLDINIMGDR